MKKVTYRDKDNNKKEILAEKLQFRPSVYGIIFNEDKSKVLLSKQWDGYDFPGGGKELFSTPDFCHFFQISPTTCFVNP